MSRAIPDKELQALKIPMLSARTGVTMISVCTKAAGRSPRVTLGPVGPNGESVGGTL